LLTLERSTAVERLERFEKALYTEERDLQAQKRAVSLKFRLKSQASLVQSDVALLRPAAR
jgi:hypothetical protein